MPITWADRVANLTKALGRKPTLDEMLEASHIHQMTPAEIEAQRQSWARSARPAGYGMTADQITARIAEVTLKIAALKVPGAARNALEEERRELSASLRRLGQ